MSKLIWFLIILGVLYYGYTHYLVPILPADPIGDFWRSLTDYVRGFMGPGALGTGLPFN